MQISARSTNCYVLLTTVDSIMELPWEGEREGELLRRKLMSIGTERDGPLNGRGPEPWPQPLTS